MARLLLPPHLHCMLVVDHKSCPHGEAGEVPGIPSTLGRDVKLQGPMRLRRRGAWIAEVKLLQDLRLGQEHQIARLASQPQRPCGARLRLPPAHNPTLLGKLHDSVLRVLHGRNARLHRRWDHLRACAASAAETALEETVHCILDDGLDALLGCYASDQLGDDQVCLLRELNLHGIPLDDFYRVLKLLVCHCLSGHLRGSFVLLDGVDLARACSGSHDRQQGE
mmetsp:Transcript_70525/g.210297  ORF Transcript_70525/g.210297 Transcript_70525/m.210297 type:complete len:223 (+) Transcript_70525:235-903(+)